MRGSEPFTFEGELRLEDLDGRTRVTNTIDAGADGRLTKVMFAVAGPLLRRVMAGRLGEELEALKSEVESGPMPRAA